MRAADDLVASADEGLRSLLIFAASTGGDPGGVLREGNFDGSLAQPCALRNPPAFSVSAPLP